MDEFEEIRKKRRQRGTEAKERVLQRVYNPQPQEQGQGTDEFEAIRNRKPISSSSLSGRMSPEDGALYAKSALGRVEAEKQQAEKVKETNRQTFEAAGLGYGGDKFKQHMGVIKGIADQSNLKVAEAEAAEKKWDDEHHRNTPVIGPVLRTLDKFADSKPVKTVGDVGLSLYTPGAGLTALNAGTKAAGALVSKVAPGLGKTFAGKAAKTAAQEAIVGAPTSIGNQLARDPNSSGKQLLEAGVYGGVGGAVLGGAAPLIKPGFQKGVQLVKSGLKSLDAQAPKLGISATKIRGQKLRTPDNPERVVDLIDVGGRPNKKEGGSLWERFYTSIVNEQAPITRATKQMGGKNVPFEQDPSKLAWLSRGWKGKADTKLQYGFMDEAGNKVGAGFKEAIEPIKNRLDDWREYAVAMRSLEYGDMESGVPRELAEKTIQKYANDKELQSAYEASKKYIDDMVKDTLVQSGLWSEAKQQFYKETQPNYMPMFRTEEKGLRDGIQGASGKGFGNVKDPTKKRTGSRRAIVDPAESIIKMTYKNQALAERNNVMRSLVELAEKKPDNALIRPMKGSSALDEVQRSLDAFISNPTDDLEKQLTNALDLFKPQTVDGQTNVFTVMRNGKAEQWQIMDEQLAKVVAGLGNEPSNPLINMVGKATGILKAGLVLAPDFVVKNLVRDQMSAFINSKYGFIPIWDTISGLWSAGVKDDFFYKWMGSGGANGAWVSLERDYLQGQIRDLTQKNIRKMSNPVEVMRKLSEWSEQGTRLGEFKRGLKKGASLKEAALASRDVTLDFSRIGSKTKSANKAIAFFNVAIQSMDKMARQFKERPVATPIKATLSITVPSIWLYMRNHNNPHYQELPQWEKDTHWHIYTKANEAPIKIPKPFEMGTIFGTFFERLMRDYKDNDPEAFEGFAKQTLDGFTPSVIPTLLTPWIEAYANKDMFTKAPIVPRREQGLLPEDQYGPYTSEISKGIGGKIGTSPRVLENYITGYTGTLGRYALQSADKMYTKASGIKTPPRPDGGNANTPVLRSFASKGLEGASKSVDDFYKEKDRLSSERNSSRKHLKPYAEEAKFNFFNKVSDAIGGEQAKIRAIMEDMAMSPEEKRDRIKNINISIINLARRAKGLEPIEK